MPEGYVFEGWYSDPQFTVKFDQNVFGDRDLVLYPKLSTEIEYLMNGIQTRYGSELSTTSGGIDYVVYNVDLKSYLSRDIFDQGSLFSITVYEDKNIDVRVITKDFGDGLRFYTFVNFEYVETSSEPYKGPIKTDISVVAGYLDDPSDNIDLAVSTNVSLNLLTYASTFDWQDGNFNISDEFTNLVKLIIQNVIFPEVALLLYRFDLLLR